MPAVTILGNGEVCGTYLLKMAASREIYMRFGRYRGGMPIRVSSGDMIYIGSAMARKGSMTLARRLLRHATRRPPRPPHVLRSQLQEALSSEGMTAATIQSPEQKKLFWNIDFLLDEESVHLQQIFILRTLHRLEDDAARMIAEDPCSSVIASGLGAHDRPGGTHLFHITADRRWWEDLPNRLAELLRTTTINPDRK